MLGDVTQRRGKIVPRNTNHRRTKPRLQGGCRSGLYVVPLAVIRQFPLTKHVSSVKPCKIPCLLILLVCFPLDSSATIVILISANCRPFRLSANGVPREVRTSGRWHRCPCSVSQKGRASMPSPSAPGGLNSEVAKDREDEFRALTNSQKLRCLFCGEPLRFEDKDTFSSSGHCVSCSRKTETGQSPD